MGISYNGDSLVNLIPNGWFDTGDLTHFTASLVIANTTGGLYGNTCMQTSSNQYGSTYQSNTFVEIDTTKYYQFAISVKTIANNYLGNPGSGHLGLSCYDSSFSFIDNRSNGRFGNTTLSRDLTAGDDYAYISNVESLSTTAGGNGWMIANSTYFYRNLIIWPATHPLYSTPYEYTRIGYPSPSIHYNEITPTGVGGEYRLTLCNSSNVATQMPDIGYSTPAGTPVGNGRAGSTYSYFLGNPNYPTEWTTYITPIITGLHRDDTNYAFRFGTRYVKVLNLMNYNYRTETAGSAAQYLIDGCTLIERPVNVALTASFYEQYYSLPHRRRYGVV